LGRNVGDHADVYLYPPKSLLHILSIISSDDHECLLQNVTGYTLTLKFTPVANTKITS